jgi:hypothetical protein
MTRIPVAIALLLISWVVTAQDNRAITLYRGPDSNHVSIKGIRQVTRSAALKNRPAIEVELDEPANDARAAMEWCLHVGNLRFAWPIHRPSSHTLVFAIDTKAWKKLRNGDPMLLTWGYEKEQSTRPFAYLDKKLLRQR